MKKQSGLSVINTPVALYGKAAAADDLISK